MTQDQIKHLEFIQNVITRMNANSFQIKGWTITIVSALLAIYASSSNVAYIFVAIAPTLLFWFLDAYYLQQETKYRKLYESAIAENTVISPFNMNASGFKVCYCGIFLSKTIVWVYGVICVALLSGGLVLKYKDCITFNC